MTHFAKGRDRCWSIAPWHWFTRCMLNRGHPGFHMHVKRKPDPYDVWKFHKKERQWQ